MAWRMNQVASARRRDGRADGSNSSDGEAWPWKEHSARDASGGAAREVALPVVADSGRWRWVTGAGDGRTGHGEMAWRLRSNGGRRRHGR